MKTELNITEEEAEKIANAILGIAGTQIKNYMPNTRNLITAGTQHLLRELVIKKLEAHFENLKSN